MYPISYGINEIFSASVNCFENGLDKCSDRYQYPTIPLQPSSSISICVSHSSLESIIFGTKPESEFLLALVL